MPRVVALIVAIAQAAYAFAPAAFGLIRELAGYGGTSGRGADAVCRGGDGAGAGDGGVSAGEASVEVHETI